MLIRVDYWHDEDTPEMTGWYICHYDTADDMLAHSPYDTIGPYESEAEAKRVLAETMDIKDDETSIKRKKPYDPSTDPSPAAFAAQATSLDSDDDTEAEADTGESVQLELQQVEELRDLPPEVQGD